MRNRKDSLRAVLALSFTLSAIGSWAVPTYDPNEKLYTYLSIWEEKGYLEPLPMLRPYTPQLIRRCLQRVIGKGTGLDRALAEGLLAEIDGQDSLMALKPAEETLMLVNLDASAEGFLTTDPVDTFLRPGLELSLSGGIGALVRFSGTAAFYMWDKKESGFIPHGTEERIFYSLGGGASMTLGETLFHLPSLWRGGVFFGTEDLSFQAGLMKSSFGPFFETSAVLGPQAPEAGHFSFTYQGGWLRLNSVLLSLTATEGVDADWDFYPLLSGSRLFPSKYLILHSAAVDPLPWLSLGFMQSTVFGGRLDPLYLIPFQILADSQIYGGDRDNSLMGLYAQFRLPWNLGAKASLYVDDLNSNSVLTLNFDSGQNKVALHLGAVWTPELPVLLRLSAEYLAITPYMYTHYRLLPLGYLNYTTFDRNLGSVLQPNSDQLLIRAELQALSWLYGELHFRMSRHGNGSDHGSGTVSWDGSIWDDGFAVGTGATFFGPSTFLTQSTLEWIFQAGAAVETDLSLPPVKLSARGEYTFEYVLNKELVPGADTLNNYLKLTLRVRL
jgi:hypothetical protein